LKEKEIELKEETLNAIEISIKIDNLAKIISSRLRNPKISSEQRKLLIELKSKINRRTVLSNNWTVIQLKFQQVYPDFISNLATVIPGLTRYQMIFIAATFMGLNTGQMADLLNISEDSVRKNRYRLKRKLGLGNSDDFYEYIYSLGTRGKIL
jgi:DNA-binding CsgD family transcriptional regulator